MYPDSSTLPLTSGKDGLSDRRVLSQSPFSFACFIAGSSALQLGVVEGVLSVRLLLEIQRWFWLEKVIDQPLFTLHSSSRETRPSSIPPALPGSIGSPGSPAGIPIIKLSPELNQHIIWLWYKNGAVRGSLGAPGGYRQVWGV